DGVQQSAYLASILLHRNKEFTRLTIFLQSDCNVTFMSGNLEPVRKRHPRVRHTMSDGLIQPTADRSQFFLQFENALLKFLALDGDIQWAGITDTGYSGAHVFCLARIERRGTFRAVAINRDRFQSEPPPL